MVMGILNQEVSDAEYIRQVLYDQVERLGENGNDLILNVLDVPLNPNGIGAAELSEFYAQVGNRSLLSNFFRVETSELNLISFDTEARWFNLEWLLKVVGVGVLLLAGISLLKYLFKST